MRGKPQGTAPRTLDGARVAFAGQFATVTRDEAAELAAGAGALPVPVAGDDTALVVVGDAAWPVRDDGRLAENLDRADRLRAEGRSIEVIAEATFLARLGLAAEQADRPRRFTITQLSRILSLPRRRIRAWIRRGLIRPAEHVHRIDYFDLHQVAELKRLAELAENRVPVETIRESLRQLASWFPETESALARLEGLEGEDGLLVRLQGGKLAEPTGQLRLFESPGAPPGSSETEGPVRATPAAPGRNAPGATPDLSVAGGAAPPARETAPAPDRPAPASNIVQFPGARPEPAPATEARHTADEWFEIAVEHEEAERPEDAARAYREALLVGGPSSEIAFNLGNVLFSLGRWEEALSRFQQAVEVDPDYAEAWNNLASVHAQFGEWQDAIDAGLRALDLAPDFADAHYNLAEAYHKSDRDTEARRHARAYLRTDPRSPWAARLRQSLALS